MLKFGFDARELNFSTNKVKVYTLPNLDEKVKHVRENYDVFKFNDTDWIFMSLPLVRRLFTLPRTHAIEVKNSDSEEHEQFHVNALSFFQGHRLSYHEYNGYLDAAPIMTNDRNRLVCFLMSRFQYKAIIERSENFWQLYKHIPNFSMKFENIIYGLFFSRKPGLINHEAFNQAYEVFEAYWELFVHIAKIETPETNISRRISHSNRLQLILDYYKMQMPSGWVGELVERRNLLQHGLIVGNKGKWYVDENLWSYFTFPMRRLIDMLIFAMIIGKESASSINCFFTEENIFGYFPIDLQLNRRYRHHWMGGG